jgi:phosphatidylglycerol:prolipoprotein diacylglycerol transferase
VLVAAGFLFGLLWAGRRAKAAGIEPSQVSDLGVWLIVAGMGGAKLFHVALFWDEFMTGWRMEGLKSLREGFVFYGGFIAACVATIVFARCRQLNLWKLADAFAPAVALGHALGRLGCFFNGCCYGTPTTCALGVKFPAGHLMHDIPVHPTQLYEVAGNLALMVGLLVWERRQRFAGQVWWMYVTSYGVVRLVVEYWRGDYAERMFGLFSAGQVVAAAMVVTGLVALQIMGRKKR